MKYSTGHTDRYILLEKNLQSHSVEELAVAVGNDESFRHLRQFRNSSIAHCSGKNTSEKFRVWLSSEGLLSDGINAVDLGSLPSWGATVILKSIMRTHDAVQYLCIPRPL